MKEDESFLVGRHVTNLDKYSEEKKEEKRSDT